MTFINPDSFNWVKSLSPRFSNGLPTQKSQPQKSNFFESHSSDEESEQNGSFHTIALSPILNENYFTIPEENKIKSTQKMTKEEEDDFWENQWLFLSPIEKPKYPRSQQSSAHSSICHTPEFKFFQKINEALIEVESCKKQNILPYEDIIPDISITNKVTETPDTLKNQLQVVPYSNKISLIDKEEISLITSLTKLAFFGSIYAAIRFCEWGYSLTNQEKKERKQENLK